MFNIIFAILSSAYKNVSTYVHQAQGTKQRWGSQYTPEFWVFNMELASCHLSGAQNLEVTPQFLDHWLSVPQTNPVYVTKNTE